MYRYGQAPILNALLSVTLGYVSNLAILQESSAVTQP